MKRKLLTFLLIGTLVASTLSPTYASPIQEDASVESSLEKKSNEQEVTELEEDSTSEQAESEENLEDNTKENVVENSKNNDDLLENESVSENTEDSVVDDVVTEEGELAQLQEEGNISVLFDVSNLDDTVSVQYSYGEGKTPFESGASIPAGSIHISADNLGETMIEVVKTYTDSGKSYTKFDYLSPNRLSITDSNANCDATYTLKTIPLYRFDFSNLEGVTISSSFTWKEGMDPDRSSEHITGDVFYGSEITGVALLPKYAQITMVYYYENSQHVSSYTLPDTINAFRIKDTTGKEYGVMSDFRDVSVDGVGSYYYYYIDKGWAVHLVLPAEDVTFKKEDLTAYLVEDAKDIGFHYQSDSGLFAISENYSSNENNEDEELFYYYFLPGSNVTMSADGWKDHRTTFSIYPKGNKEAKIIENGVIDGNTKNVSFTMPESVVVVDSEKSDYQSKILTIDKENVSKKDDAQVARFDETNDCELIESGEEIKETTQLGVRSVSVSQDQKMLVKVTKTGTNEVLTGSKNGVFVDSLKWLLFGMPAENTTISFIEKTVNGTGKQVVIQEDLTADSEVSYSVAGTGGYTITSGDKVEPGKTVSVKIDKVRPGHSIALNVICPDQNLVASGNGKENDFTKAYYSKIKSKPGTCTFTMPDYPITLIVRETEGVTEEEPEEPDDSEFNLAQAVVSLKTSSFVYTGSEVKPNYTVKYGRTTLKKGVDYSEQYSNNTNAGTAILTVNGMGKYGGSQQKEFEIKQKDISTIAKENISIPVKMPFDSETIEPQPELTFNDKKLERGTDYTVTYENNTYVTDSAKIKIQGIGNFTGKIEREFIIYPVLTDLSDAEIVLDSTEYEYTGSEICPQFVVKHRGAELDSDNFTYRYFMNKEVGIGGIQITGRGYYCGSAQTSFTIKKRSFTSELFSAKVENVKYSRKKNEYKPVPIVTYNGIALIDGVDYEVAYSNNTEVTDDAKVSITGKNHYEGEVELSFKIMDDSVQVSSLSVVLSQKSFVYNGDACEPGVSVTRKVKGAKETVDAENYEVLYLNNVNAGTATVKIIGKGDYIGTKSLNYKISPKNFSDETVLVSEIPEQPFSGVNTPVPTIKDKALNTKLTNKDFTCSYSSNKKVGTAKITIKGSGNYKGTLKKNFTIGAVDFENFQFFIADQSYTGAKLCPDITAVNKVTGETLVLPVSATFKATWKNNIKVGEASVTFVPKNKTYISFNPATQKAKTVYFNIVKCNLADTVVKPIADQKYKKGKAVKPKLTVLCGGKALSPKLYKVTYANNCDKGIATATITPASNIDIIGEQTVSFVIK